jgi:hypothetical protein
LTFESAEVDAKQAFNRVMWIDHKTMQIVNEEGFEKLVDIEDDFSEISFNWRPLFTEINGNEYERCIYYYEREQIEERDVLSRLKRVYQQYKTSYNLFKRRSSTELYQDMITVEPFNWNFNINSFTFLHWSILEQIQDGWLEIADLEKEVLE